MPSARGSGRGGRWPRSTYSRSMWPDEAVSMSPRVGPDALRWERQTARATWGRDLQLNVPFPRKPPDLLMAESPPTGGLSALTGRAARPARGAGSRQDVVERRREALAGLLELALDVQSRRSGLGPQVEEVGPARHGGVVGLGDRLDAVHLARRQHERLRAVVLDATAQVVDFEPIAGQGAELVVAAVHDQFDDVLECPVHRIGHQLERFPDLFPSAQLGARREAEPVVEVVLARRARLAANAPRQPRGAEREGPRLDRFLERPVPARDLRGDRATMLGVARHR